MEGIFRISGSTVQLKELQKAYIKGKTINFVNTEAQNLNIHTIACLLKNYFRDSEDPLFTFEKYNEFLKISNEFLK